jgi:hypothetical protein
MDASGRRHTHVGSCRREPIHPCPETSNTHPTYRKCGCRSRCAHPGRYMDLERHLSHTGSLKDHAQRHHFQTYLTTRDTLRDPHTPNGRWSNYAPHLTEALTGAKKSRSSRSRGRLAKHLYDWMAHASNLDDSREAAAKCVLCGKTEMQGHIHTTCSHPALMDLRHLHQRKIDLYLLAVRCTPLPPMNPIHLSLR